jgi:hypothetical protein
MLARVGLDANDGSVKDANGAFNAILKGQTDAGSQGFVPKLAAEFQLPKGKGDAGAQTAFNAAPFDAQALVDPAKVLADEDKERAHVVGA